MEHIALESRKRDTHKYYVVLNYMQGDSNDDKKHIPDDQDGNCVYRVEVYADSVMNAITRGVEIVTHARAEIMADYVTNNPLSQGKEVFTRDEIDAIYRTAVEIGLFQSWLAIQPTGIQCNRVDDEDILIDMTVENVFQHTSHIGDDAEDFLKEQDNDDA